MRVHWHAAALMLATMSLFACGNANDGRPVDGDRRASDEAQQTAGETQKGREQTAGGLETVTPGRPGAASAGDPDVKRVEPMGFRQLQTMLPDVAGWKKGSPTGERLTSPFSFSQASVIYQKGYAEAEEKILDSGFNQMLFTPFKTLMAEGYEKETAEGFERSVTVAGHPGWEKWDKGTRNGELSVVVNRRFLVQVEGRGIDDMRTLHTLLDQTDFEKLASLK